MTRGITSFLDFDSPVSSTFGDCPSSSESTESMATSISEGSATSDSQYAEYGTFIDRVIAHDQPMLLPLHQIRLPNHRTPVLEPDSPTIGSNLESLARSSVGSTISCGGSSYSGDSRLSFHSGEVLQLCTPPISKRNSRASQASSTFSSMRPVSTSLPFNNRPFSASSSELVPKMERPQSITAAEKYLNMVRSRPTTDLNEPFSHRVTLSQEKRSPTSSPTRPNSSRNAHQQSRQPLAPVQGRNSQDSSGSASKLRKRVSMFWKKPKRSAVQ